MSGDARLWPGRLLTVKMGGMKDDKAERLAKALRDNLRKRKTQARESSGQDEPADDRRP